MTTWRVIITDSESMTGVAPVCRGPVQHESHHVEDCCRGPHIELWSERAAYETAKALTNADAEECS